MNPKHIRAQKEGKAPMEYLVTSVLEGDAHVHKGGADKYGIRNWLIDKILASTYVGAMFRHLKAWAEGEDIDPESGYSHLYHLRSCCAIVLDSEMHGTLIDDRLKTESIDQGERQNAGPGLPNKYRDRATVDSLRYKTYGADPDKHPLEKELEAAGIPVETPEEKRELDFIERSKAFRLKD